MKTFKLSAKVTVSAYTTVEAETAEEAILIAEQRDVGIGGLGSGLSEEDGWIIDEADGDTVDITVDED